MNPLEIIQLIAVLVTLVLIIIVSVTVGFIARENGRNGTLWRQLTGLALLIITGSVFGLIYFVNPLPSDEAMIEHFNEHRAEYEELAAGFIQAGKEGNESVKGWLASSRTLQLKRSIKAKDERNIDDESAQWFSGVQLNGFQNSDKGTVDFYIEEGVKFSWRGMNPMWKIYMYLPESLPEVEGRLQCPAGSGRKCLGDFYEPIVPSLNGYPKFHEEKRRNCGTLMRKIDEHWYLKLIRAC